LRQVKFLLKFYLPFTIFNLSSRPVFYTGAIPKASVYTHNKKLIQKLRRLSEKCPDKVKRRPEHRGAVSYLVPKGRLSTLRFSVLR
jgi:hypothetical protein